MNIHKENDIIQVIENTAFLSDRQQSHIRCLAQFCRHHDHICLTYPLDQEAPSSAPDLPVRHYLLYRSEILISALALLPCQEDAAECVAFTHPRYRNRGCFSRLFNLALESCQTCPILFPVSGCCGDTLAALQSLNAELECQEHQMSLDLEYFSDEMPDCPGTVFLQTPHSIWEEFALWKLHQTDGASPCYSSPGSLQPIGSCQTSPVSDGCICLHHVEILPRFRRQGHGRLLVGLLLSQLGSSGIRRVILHVSGDNAPAIALYKKTGFHISETLSYYLYCRTQMEY